MAADVVYTVKAKKDGEKCWRLIGNEGYLTRLRIHACRYNVGQVAREVEEFTG